MLTVYVYLQKGTEALKKPKNQKQKEKISECSSHEIASDHVKKKIFITHSYVMPNMSNTWFGGRGLGKQCPSHCKQRSGL